MPPAQRPTQKQHEDGTGLARRPTQEQNEDDAGPARKPAQKQHEDGTGSARRPSQKQNEDNTGSDRRPTQKQYREDFFFVCLRTGTIHRASRADLPMQYFSVTFPASFTNGTALSVPFAMVARAPTMSSPEYVMVAFGDMPLAASAQICYKKWFFIVTCQCN